MADHHHRTAHDAAGHPDNSEPIKGANGRDKMEQIRDNPTAGGL